MPWIAHNAGRFEEPVYLSTGLGNTLLAGNCDGAYGGALYGSYDTRCNFVLAVPADNDPSEVDLLRREAAFDYISDHLGELPAVALAREGRVAGVDRFQQTTRLWSDWSNTPLWVVRTWLITSWALLAVAVVGIVALRRRAVPVYPLAGLVAITLLSIGLTIGEVRYRAGLEAPLVLLAAVGTVAIAERLWSSGRRREDPSEKLGAHESADLIGVAQVPDSR